MKKLILSVGLLFSLSACFFNSGPTSPGCKFTGTVDPGLVAGTEKAFSCVNDCAAAAIMATYQGLEATIGMCEPAAAMKAKISMSLLSGGVLGSACTMLVDAFIPGVMGLGIPSSWTACGCTMPPSAVSGVETALTMACGLIPATQAQLQK